MKPPILDLHSAKQKPSLLVFIRDIVLTILMWIFFLYLIEDVFGGAVTLKNWFFSENEPAELSRLVAVLKTLMSYGATIFLIGGLLVVWALYNKLYFGRKQRRKSIPPTDTTEIARMFRIPIEQVEDMKSANHILLEHAKNGRITHIECDGHPCFAAPKNPKQLSTKR